MRRAVAISRLNKIISRLNENEGIIQTPECNFQAVKINVAYLFGSVLKGSESPNDIDIIVEYEVVGDYMNPEQLGCFDKYRFRACGLKLSKCCWEDAIKTLRRHIPMVSIHQLKYDGNVAHPRVMIFPVNQFSETKVGDLSHD